MRVIVQWVAAALIVCGAGFLVARRNADEEAPRHDVSARCVRSFRPHDAVLRQLAFSPDDRVLATSSANGAVKLWRVDDGTLVRALVDPGGVASLAFSPDGQSLVTGSYDRPVRSWRVADGALLHTANGHGGTVWSVAFSPNGNVVASSGEDATVRLWRAADGAPLRILR